MADPLAPNDPRPAMLTEVAFVLAQVRTEDAPLAMLAGCAVNLIVGCVDDPVIVVTVTLEVAVPAGPVAVALYVVVAVGVTITEPVAPNVPTPAMLTEVAFVDVHFRVAVEPVVMLVGWALIAIVGCRGFCRDWGVNPEAPEQPKPVASAKNKRTISKRTAGRMRISLLRKPHGGGSARMIWISIRIAGSVERLPSSHNRASFLSRDILESS